MADDIVTILQLSCITLIVDGTTCATSPRPVTCPMCRAANEIMDLRSTCAILEAINILTHPETK